MRVWASGKPGGIEGLVVAGGTRAGSGMFADLVLRVGEDVSYLAAEVDVAGVRGLP
jgi:hypothetical protein